MTLREAFEAYYAKFGADAAPAITWFLRLPEETQLEIFMQGINDNTPIVGEVAEKISRRLYPEFWEDTTGHVVI
jgi:hypothetical protein